MPNPRVGVERVVDYSFRLARQRRGHLTLWHKKNSLIEAGNPWQDTVNDLSFHYPEVDLDSVHVDAMFFHLPVAPERFDGVVTDNLFGRHHRRPGRSPTWTPSFSAGPATQPSRSRPPR
ncbi:MAG: isocitrate/isopropylmalate family dehydrogenase [Actinomycetota bacterium]|nr:isocitrate/isopropylmalate family dehydrogenase [Actinomycetota bacterium]